MAVSFPCRGAVGKAFRACRIAFTAVLLTISGVFSLSAQSGDFLYATNGGTVVLTKYAGPGGVVTTPDFIEGLPVTRIGEWAFEGCTNLTSVITLNNIRDIRLGAFRSCVNLERVALGAGITNIEHGALHECPSLAEVMVSPDNYSFSSRDGILFDKNQTKLLLYPAARGGSYTIPEGVETIDFWAFEFCTRLTSVTLPNTVRRIGGCAFFGCTALESVNIPAGVNEIEEQAFAYCSSLTAVTLPASVGLLTAHAFLNCTNLAAVYFYGNAPLEALSFLGRSPFEGDAWATNYFLPGTVGWELSFNGRPVVPWHLGNPRILLLPVSGQTNSFSFVLSWATNASVVVEACTNLANPAWTPVATNTLVDGSAAFVDPDFAVCWARFYRLRAL